MVNITFRLKGYDKGDVNLFLNTTNPPHETMKLMFILELLVFFNYYMATPYFYFSL
jgi:hypothetical protein